MPSADALTSEFVSVRVHSVVATIMMSGVPVGGTTAALVGCELLATHGWRPSYAVAFVPAVVLPPLRRRFVPESPTWLRSRGRLYEVGGQYRRNI